MKLVLREGASFCTSWSATHSRPPTFGCSVRDSISIDLSSGRSRSPNRSSFTTSLELVSVRSHKTTIFCTCFCLLYTNSLELVSGQHPIIKLPFLILYNYILVFVYLNIQYVLLTALFTVQHWEKTKWYRPFLDYTILVSFKREFCIKISENIQIVQLTKLEFFFLTNDSLLRETSVFKFVGRSGIQFVDHQVYEGVWHPVTFTFYN